MMLCGIAVLKEENGKYQWFGQGDRKIGPELTDKELALAYAMFSQWEPLLGTRAVA
jgi:hypothetical protein